MQIRCHRSIDAVVRVASRARRCNPVSAGHLERDRTVATSRSTLETIALAVILSAVLVAGAAGPVIATGAPIAQDDSGGDDGTAGADGAVFADDPAELESFVDEVIAEQRAAGDVPGATVAVVEGNETVLAKGYGEADVETGAPVRANETAFMVGSVGKLVTWTAVMQGVEDGTLELDEDVNTYLEDSDVEIPDTYDEPVTLRHLGTHTAGFDTHVNPGMVEDADNVGSLEDALVENRPDRIRPPGEYPSYSNYGTMLAGHVVAEAHDTTFEEYVQSEVFGPLEMDHSTFAQPVPEDHLGELAAPHTTTDDGVERADRVYIDWRPAGSMSATSPEMATFMSAHLGDGAADGARILKPETAERMHEVHHERHPAINNWRYGFHEYGPADADLIGHSGATLHETSMLVLAPEDDVGIFVNYNVRTGAASPSDAVDEILEEYDVQLEGDADGATTDEMTADGATADGAADRAAAVAGEYRFTMSPQDGPGQIVGLLSRLSIDATDDGRLTSSILGTNEQEWVEVEPYVYREVDGHDVLVADVEDGDVDAVHLNSQPQLALEPVAVHERTLVVGAILGVALAGFALSLLGWLGLAAWRRWTRWRAADDVGDAHDTGDAGDADTTGSTDAVDDIDDASRAGVSRATGDAEPASLRHRLASRLRRPAWLGRAAAVALCIVSLLVAVLFLTALGRNGELAFVTMPASLRASLALAPLVGVLAVATVAGSVLAWADGYWSRRARLHQTLLAVLGLVFAWQLFRFGLMGV